MTKQIEGQMSIFDLATWSGKTYPERSVVTKARTSEPSLKKRQGSQIKTPLFLDLRGGGLRAVASWETDGASLGVYMMHSFGEYPREENVSRLSQILEEKPHPKYSLSAKACQGILRRAEKRGKQLPEQLRIALEHQSASKNEPENGKAEAPYSGECRYGGDESYVMQGFDAYNQQRTGDKAMTLRAERTDQEHIPCVYGFEPGVAKRLDPENRFIEEKTPTLRANMGDNQTSVVACIEGNGSRPSHQGDGYSESEVSYTLNAVEKHGVCTYQDVTGTLNPDGHPGSYNGQDAYNDMLVIDKAIGVDCHNATVNEDKTNTMLAGNNDNHNVPGVCYGLDRASFNQGQNAQYDFSVQEEVAQTIVARGPGGVLTQ